MAQRRKAPRPKIMMTITEILVEFIHSLAKSSNKVKKSVLHCFHIVQIEHVLLFDHQFYPIDLQFLT